MATCDIFKKTEANKVTFTEVWDRRALGAKSPVSDAAFRKSGQRAKKDMLK